MVIHDAKWKKLLNDRRYNGILLAVVLTAAFIGISLLVNPFLHGAPWFLFSSALRILFGAGILFAARKLYGRSAGEVLRLDRTKTALVAGAGFLLYFLYYLIDVSVGVKAITEIASALFFTKVILQQIATGFYEELHYRFLICEGYFHGKQTVTRRLLYAFLSFLIFGALHIVTGWDAYRFLLTGVIGFAFAAMYLCSRNIVIPMLLHTLYDVVANLDVFIEWNQSPLFQMVNDLFDAVVIIMFVISLVMLIGEEKLISTKKRRMKA